MPQVSSNELSQGSDDTDQSSAVPQYRLQPESGPSIPAFARCMIRHAALSGFTSVYSVPSVGLSIWNLRVHQVSAVQNH
jgi:hypothetical protein